jgi:acyl-[acyl-carrier-protein]-phospholipid O-acyltransferase/long-chain-fatty-acid--[acyl-carrier-protein] ligase
MMEASSKLPAVFLLVNQTPSAAGGDSSILTWLGLALLVVILVQFAALMWLRPELVVRIPFWILAHTIYQMRTTGRRNIPKTGPALMVCNHVSYIDALLLFTAQRRPVRFVIWAPFTQVPVLRWLLKLARVIPIDSTKPKTIVQGLRAASDALAQGDLVCIFAEGALTRTGFMLPFHRGFEQIVKRCPAPIIPVCLDHVWGSIFSWHGGKLFWKWPQKLPYPVRVAFGQPMPPTATAVEVRQAIQKMSADLAIAWGDERRPVHRQFVRMAARHPFRPCIIDPNSPKPMLRYGEVLVAARLLSLKIRPHVQDDQMVGIWLPPSLGGALANIAVCLLGKVPVNLNYTAGIDSIRSAVSQCKLRVVLSGRAFTSKMPLDLGEDVKIVYLDELRKEITTLDRVLSFAAVLCLPGFVLERWLYRLGGHKPDDLATIIFSSGSTGEPKGVMLTHKNIAANVESMIQAIDPRPSDRLLGVLPFFHSFGFTVTLWVPLQVGASSVYYADPRQAKEIGELCRKHRCTLFLTTPTFLRFCLRRCEKGDFDTLRILMCGAEKLPRSLAEEFKEKFGILPLEGYGCTELSPVACANVPDWIENDVTQIGNKPGSIGQPLPGVAARIVDPETFEPVPHGAEGLLLIYGANVMKGYLGKEEATRNVLRDGWYVTGDIARFDDDGFITLTDRLARFSKIGGEMVPHGKIEDELHAILETTERTCVVSSVPDEKKGERLVVLHTPLNGANPRTLCQKLQSRGLPNLWIPSERDFYPIEEMPILGSGKLDLKRVKEIALARAK